MSGSSAHPDAGGPLHFVCGVIFGGALLSLLLLRQIAHPTSIMWIAVAVGALALGLIARRYAGDFWDDFLKWFDLF